MDSSSQRSRWNSTMNTLGSNQDITLLNEELQQGSLLSSRSSNRMERYLTLKPIVAFGLTVDPTWEFIALTFQANALNGGPSGLLYGTMISIVGTISIVLSMAEMASIDCTVGAQYRWSVRFCPKGMNGRFWGLLVGWLTIGAWITASAFTSFLLGTITNSLLNFNNVDRTSLPWHVTLLSFGYIIVVVAGNVFSRKLLSLFEVTGAICHFLFFIIIVCTLTLLSRRSSTSFVWSNFSSIGGWTNPAISFCIGMTTPSYALGGFDAIIHFSDEVQDVSRKVPQALAITCIANSILMLGFTICLLYCVGDFSDVVNSPTGLPILAVFFAATKSMTATNTLACFILILMLVCSFGVVASVTRLYWTFARDHGVPYSKFFSYVHPKLLIPTHALALVTVITSAIAFINIASPYAFSAIVSLSTIATVLSYAIPICFFLNHRLTRTDVSFGPFALGRWGIATNVIAIVYTIFITIWLPFPISVPVTLATFNFSGPVLALCILLAILDWYTGGKHRFKIRQSQALPIQKPQIKHEPDDIGMMFCTGDDILTSDSTTLKG